MTKHTTTVPTLPARTIGLDLSDRTLRYCELDAAGAIVAEGTLALTRTALCQYLGAQPAGTRVALETGGQSAWVRDVITGLGHEAVVGNARELAAVTQSLQRTDSRDARQLARLARLDPQLLNPVELRDAARQADLFVVRARALLVDVRTKLINFARGVTKALGHRLPASTSHRFAERVRAAVPEALAPALGPLLAVLETIEEQLAGYDAQVETLAAEQYPETRWLQQVPGVGTLTALTFVLTVGPPERFAHSRDAGAFLGLVPRRRQSGECDPHLGITKSGDRYLRRLLVQCAHVLLGRWGADCALRQWGLAHAQSRAQKKRTVVAVARKLAVLLHRLWRRQEVFRPFPQAA